MKKKIRIYKNNQIKHFHFIGIGGSGMSSIANILILEGYYVSGSDLYPSKITQKLQNIGAKIFYGHSSKNIKNANVIIISSAIPLNNIEIISAKKLNLPILIRAEILSEIMSYKHGIAVAGSHGKTTTTSMIFSIYNHSNLKPSLIAGGIVNEINNSAQLGNSNFIIVEADESDGSLIHLKPTIAILTNIDTDHLRNYQGNFNNLKKTFLNFINNLPTRGTAIICIDVIKRHIVTSNIKSKYITYGFNKKSDFFIKNYKQKKFQCFFTLIRKNNTVLKISLNIPGKHNALNATAAIATATIQGINEKKIIQALKKFQGVQRRFQMIASFNTQLINNTMKGNTLIVNDYGHHPNEIYANIKTIRCGWKEKKLIMIFQPHRYTRTYDLFYKFVTVLSLVDTLLILDVYPANEKKIIGFESINLCHTINKQSKLNSILITEYCDIPKILQLKMTNNNLILIQGAGNLDEIFHQYFLKKLFLKK